VLAILDNENLAGGDAYATPHAGREIFNSPPILEVTGMINVFLSNTICSPSCPYFRRIISSIPLFISVFIKRHSGAMCV